MALQRAKQPERINAYNYYKELEREQEMDRLQHLDNPIRRAPVQIIDVEHDAIDARQIARVCR